MQISYTFSKSMDATTFLNSQDPMPYESLSDSGSAPSHRRQRPV